MSGPIVVAGGGTGGHIFVARAVADGLLESGEAPSGLRFVGSRRGQDAALLADSGVETTLLPGRGIKRSLAPSAMIDNLGALVGIAAAFLVSLVRVGQWRPRVVVSVGGYAAAPIALAAVVWRRPLILVNVDAIPGLTHRILGPLATASCVAFEDTPLPRTSVTGAPVRAEFLQVSKDDEHIARARQDLGVDPSRPLVAVMTGSLGARSVNEAVLGLATLWADKAITLFHVTGRRDFAALEARRPPGDGRGLDYRLVEFEDRMPTLFEAADIGVTRAGALTVAELAIVGLPAVLVPLPGAPGDHQTKNAEALERAGGALVLADARVSAAELDRLVSPLLTDGAHLATMGAAARSVGHRDAARAVAEVVLRHAR